MNKIFILIYLLCSLSIHSQSNNEDIMISYDIDYKRYEDREQRSNETGVLISKNKSSVFTLKKMMSIDSIQNLREINISDLHLGTRRTSLNFFIETTDSKSFLHYEALGNDILYFEDFIELKWKFHQEKLKIGGYSCNKATTQFEGREWTAWYTTDIPLSLGPYKFHGLPGLIIKLSDSSKNFIFTALKINTGNYNIDYKPNNFFISDSKSISKTDKINFFKLRTKFTSMSLNDKIQYMNRDKPGISSLSITESNGNKVKTNRKSKIVNFIEKFDER